MIRVERTRDMPGVVAVSKEPVTVISHELWQKAYLTEDEFAELAGAIKAGRFDDFLRGKAWVVVVHPNGQVTGDAL